MTTHVQRPATVTARIDADSTPTPALLNTAPAMSMDEYQRRTLHELADDIIVCGVAYSRTEWESAEDGVQRTTTTDETPAAQSTPSARPVWDGSEAPF